MKKTTYIIIALLALALICETVFIILLSRTGHEYQGYVEDSVECPVLSDSLYNGGRPISAPGKIVIEGLSDDLFISMSNAQKTNVRQSDSVYMPDTIVIIAPQKIIVE